MSSLQMVYVQGPTLGKVVSQGDQQRLVRILEAAARILSEEYPDPPLQRITPECVAETGSMSCRLLLSDADSRKALEVSARCENLMKLFASLEAHVQTLADIARMHATSSGFGFLSRAEQACRVVGQTVNTEAGFYGMTYVCQRITDVVGRAAARELERTWEGIGGWMG